MKVEQFVMAYKAEQDHIRAMLPEEVKTHYERAEFSASSVAGIKCEQILGAYMVEFE